ncbi:pyrroline-5-carboxylate reductase [Parvularcula bermudensis HTCC2503]|uniref:Pyrroline-5-carboxylate reductase n=1 Tax=Parvularcula bermudensis (strain ATCC BAA-594 / HTCC2503 / KCTC 12087) TaxID=314260 RepID=E0TC07_PARBH|nr:pyrroline-5-carboxylate reductase [Parvularcula bermudensis]ADM09800.1 pyrroline-5-carboxylate reductase [Parvularcula bermudensis HTCC2503]
MTNKLSLLLVGAGNMGGALFTSWVEKGVLDPARSAISDPNPSDAVIALAEKAGIAINPEDDQPYEVCVLGIKPQLFGAVLPDLQFGGMNDALFISMAAGTSLGEIGKLLKGQAPNARLVRTMPNLPAAIGEGMSLLCAGEGVTDKDKAAATALMEAAGQVVWTKTEDDVDRLTGVSGSGPGFVLYVVEAFEAAAKAQGASDSDARLLAEQTIIGTALHLSRDGRTAAELRKAVTSPGGTTEAGLNVLMADERLHRLIAEAVEAAYDRAQELSS